MSANGESVPFGTSEVTDKGKGKAVDQSAPLQEEDDSDEESGIEEVHRDADYILLHSS